MISISTGVCGADELDLLLAEPQLESEVEPELEEVRDCDEREQGVEGPDMSRKDSRWNVPASLEYAVELPSLLGLLLPFLESCLLRVPKLAKERTLRRKCPAAIVVRDSQGRFS